LLSSDSDIDLWNSFKQGNQDALGTLFKKYYPLMYQYGIKICSDKSTLEDCIQELFTELWQKKATHPVQSVKAYLLHALKYKLYRSFRDNRATIKMEPSDHEFFELSHESFLIRKQEDEEKMRKTINAINQLPSRQKEIIYLRLYKGLSYEEVSEVMEINYQAVRNLLYQALKTFRKLIVSSVMK